MNIGGHGYVFENLCPEIFLERFPNYCPFVVKESELSPVMQTVVWEKELPNDPVDFIYQYEIMDGQYSFYKEASGYRIVITLKDLPPLQIWGSEDWSVCYTSATLTHPLIWRMERFLQHLFTFAGTVKNTFIVHASVIKNDGKGFLFMGHSGAGKSTHSRLWLEHISGSFLLNDDNPVLRLENQKLWVFGSPWSGKTDCYVNDCAEVFSFFNIVQAPQNKLTLLNGAKAYITMLYANSFLRWNVNLEQYLYDFIDQVLQLKPIYELECLPDKSAAVLSASVFKTSTDIAS